MITATRVAGETGIDIVVMKEGNKTAQRHSTSVHELKGKEEGGTGNREGTPVSTRSAAGRYEMESDMRNPRPRVGNRIMMPACS